MPAIVDHDAPGGPISVFESGAILLHLAEKTGRFMPTDALGRKEAVEWLFWQTGNQGPMAGQYSHFRNYAPEEEKQGYARERYTNEYYRCLGVLERRLEGREYVLGDYSIADMICWPWVLIAKAMEPLLGRPPKRRTLAPGGEATPRRATRRRSRQGHAPEPAAYGRGTQGAFRPTLTTPTSIARPLETWMTLSFETPSGGTIAIKPNACIVAGWTGRDKTAVQHHIEELAVIGVPRPSTTPLYYRAPAAILTQSDQIEALGRETGGEAEPVIVDDGERLWLALGSDHTDRGLEATSVAHSKAIAPKVLSRQAWPWDELADRLDALRLSAEISEDGQSWTAYQNDALAKIAPLGDLIEGAPTTERDRLGGGAVMFCGTVPAIDGVRPTPWFRAALEDPATGRRLTLSYRTEALPVVS